ncbi:hypothetical protein [Asticcacaulis sp.]|uniref:hypothetical protein n=1 Tax=Asticcacaulis sp. TaxID=1872648 RepID=UPI00260BA206|nr:hypothetical protein [Asticcacaulis sp.]
MASTFDPLSTGTTYVDPRQTTTVNDWGSVIQGIAGGFFNWQTAKSTGVAPGQQYGTAGQVPQTRTYAGGAMPMDFTPLILLGGFGLAAVLLLRK